MKITHTAVFEGELQLSLTDDWLPWSSGKLVEIKIEGDRLLCSSYSTSCVSLQCGKCVQIKKKKSLRTNTGGPFRLQPELPELHITRQTFANTVRLLVELQIVYMSKDTVYKSNRERERERECCPCLALPRGTQEWLRSIKYGSRLSFHCQQGFQKHIFARCWSVTRVSLWQTSFERPKPSSAQLWVHHQPSGLLIGPGSSSVFWVL